MACQNVANVCTYLNDPNFDSNPGQILKSPPNGQADQIYCCSEIPGFLPCEAGTCSVQSSAYCDFSFPMENNDGAPMLKTSLNATTMSPFVKIAFQQYDKDGNESPDATAATILTMGNRSQCGFCTSGQEICNSEICKASIKSFQYAWGIQNQGARCKITIVDEKGAEFEQWVQRLVKNAENDATPVAGMLRMKIQFGWYITGGGDTDVCGQQADIPNITKPGPGMNSSYTVASPTMYFLPDNINVHYEGGKFIYELEGIDTLVRSQESRIAQIFGEKKPGQGMFFTDAVELLGQSSTPPFRVQFKSIDASGNVVDMIFYRRRNEFFDDEIKGPYGVWAANELSPLATINKWIKDGPVLAKDQTNSTTNPLNVVGITMNYDPTVKATQCDPTKPQFGTLILWSQPTPACQNSFSDEEINKRMKAVYIVNGGQCSPVIQFSHNIRWNFQAAAAAGGLYNPTTGFQMKQSQGQVLSNCAITSSRGTTTYQRVNNTLMAFGQAALQLLGIANQMQTLANIRFKAIEAELRVQGDPSSWLTSPVEGTSRCVGLIYINPFFLNSDSTDNTTCPTWESIDPADVGSGTCNHILTNKGWWINGVEHQITEGKYITTLKLNLPAPMAEINAANSVNPLNVVANQLGAWANGFALPFSGAFSALTGYTIGDAAACWGIYPNSPPPVTGCNNDNVVVYVGGGSGEEAYDDASGVDPFDDFLSGPDVPVNV